MSIGLGEYLVYIDGVEVPAEGVTYHYDFDGTPFMTIRLAPDPSLRRLGREDRLHVAVFYLDKHGYKSKVFCFLSEGEIAGYSYRSTGIGRYIEFPVQHLVQGLDQLHVNFLSGIQDFWSGERLKAAGISVVSSLMTSVFPAILYLKGLTGSGSIDRPYDILENAFKCVTDKNYLEALRPAPVANFYLRWFLKIDLMERFVAMPGFDDLTGDKGEYAGGFPLLQALQGYQVLNAVLGMIQEWPRNAGLLTLIRYIYSTMDYHLGFIPAPSLVDTTLRGCLPTQTENGADVKKFPQNRLSSCVPLPSMYYAAIPRCNVMFPSMITDISFSEDYFSQPTRTFYRTTIDHLTGRASASEDVGVPLIGGYPECVSNQYGAARFRTGYAHTNYSVWPEEFFKGPVAQLIDALPWFVNLLASNKKNGDKPDPKELGKFLDDWARWQHYQARGRCRSGTVQAHFDPYLIPGFPMVVFDNEVSAHSFVAFCTGVTHNMSGGTSEWTTTARFAHADFIGDYVETVIRNKAELWALISPDLSERFAQIWVDGLVAAPAHPVAAVRDGTQYQPSAAAIYSRLLFAGEAGERSVFDLIPNLKVTAPNGKTELLSKVSAALIKSNYYNEAARVMKKEWKRAGETDNLSYAPRPGELLTCKLESKDSYTWGMKGPYLTTSGFPGSDLSASVFLPAPAIQLEWGDYDAALRYVARPVCTMDEYIATCANGSGRGKVEPTSAEGGRGAAYYKEIRAFDQGPGPAPEIDEGTGLAQEGLLVDTRFDWKTILKRFRERVIRKVPQL